MKIIIKITPKSNKDEVVFEDKDLFGNLVLKVKTSKPTEDGKANKAVAEILANYFRVAKSDVNIISGHSSRTKMVEISNHDLG